MRIIDLIAKLQALRAEYDEEYVSIAGEPEIMIDVFKEGRGYFIYTGFSCDIVIEKSTDGVYDILSAFRDSYHEPHQIEKAPQFPTGPKP